jgi:ABC-type antimicrobial peptide transport system permease subunit
MGAQNRTILVLFLIEALSIGIFGASFGLVAGIGMGYGLSATFGSDSLVLVITRMKLPRKLVLLPLPQMSRQLLRYT